MGGEDVAMVLAKDVGQEGPRRRFGRLLVGSGRQGHNQRHSVAAIFPLREIDRPVLRQLPDLGLAVDDLAPLRLQAVGVLPRRILHPLDDFLQALVVTRNLHHRLRQALGDPGALLQRSGPPATFRRRPALPSAAAAARRLGRPAPLVILKRGLLLIACEPARPTARILHDRIST